MSRHPRVVACIAAVLFAGAVLAFGAALPGYSQHVHPVALLGARGVPHALAFDVLGFVLPGLLCAWTAACLRASLPDATGWPGRIGAQVLLLSALAFALQGVFALNPDDLEAAASRMHAGIWMAWWIAFCAGAALLAMSRRRALPGRAPGALHEPGAPAGACCANFGHARGGRPRTAFVC